MPEKILHLRNEAEELRCLAELPDNAPVRNRMLALATKYEELAAERAALKKTW